MENYDVIIIGAGVTGTAIARELSRYQCKVCVLEREEDVCCGTSKANSAIIHAGYDAEPGSWKARLNVRGNEMIESLSRELDFPFKRDGSLVLCLDEKAYPDLKKLYDRGIENGVKDLQILNRDEVLSMEPNVSDKVYAALYAPTAGIVCPFHMTIAFAENAYTNGVSFHFNTEVKQIERDAKVMDGIFGLDAITGGSGEGQMLDEFSRVQTKALEKWNKFSKYNELFLPLIEGIWFLGIVAVYVFAFLKMGSIGFELGAVISFIGYITQTNEPIKQTALNYQFFVNIQTAINRIFDILRIDTTAFSVRDQLLENATPKLEVKNLCFKHPYKPVSIQDLSFEIECGEKIAIIGESGVGKTTLACLLARIYAPDSGEILLGGKNIAKIKKGEFERVVSLVRDEPALFRGSIRENLSFGEEFSDQQIYDVLKKLGLFEKVVNLKFGLDQKINDKTTFFSQSEKQLVALARVVLKDPKIIIFDSAFNSMSSRQKKKVFNIIQECFADKTCIFFCDPGADLPFECKEIKMKG